VRKILNRLTLALASGFYISYLPARLQPQKHWTGAGTLGTLWGLASWFLVSTAPVPQLAAIAGGIAASIFICGRAEKIYGKKDDQRIVLDEWAGYWVAAALLPRTGGTLIAAFILFRIFDMWKGPAGRWLSKLPGGYGVVLDDILAGLCANLTLQVFRFFLSS